MNKKIFLTLLTFVLIFQIATATEGNDPYRINDQAVNQLIDQAAPVSITDFDLITDNASEAAGKKSAFIAWALTYSIIGLHRVYLGTSTTTFIAYACTLGGFLVLDIVDFALLLVAIIDSKSIDKYVGNDHLFMWNE